MDTVNWSQSSIRGGAKRFLRRRDTVRLPPWHCTRPTAATWTRRRCCCAARTRRSAEPEGWRLAFGGEDIGWDGALATVVENPGSRVFVALYDVSEGDEKELDKWDGVTLGYYRKAKVRAETLDGDVLAWLYVLNFYEGGLPSARSIGILADSAERAGAPADYVARMRALPCAKMGDSNTGYEGSWPSPGP